MRAIGITVLALLTALAPAGAGAKGLTAIGAPQGIALPGSPYRYSALSPQGTGESLTVVVRTHSRDGRVSRWWHLRGAYQVPAATYDGSGAGLSADGGTLVLGRVSRVYPPRTSGFAILDTRVHLRHPLRDDSPAPRHAIKRVSLPGSFTIHAISPDGRTVYLSEQLSPYVGGPARIRALDAKTGKLLPLAAVGAHSGERRLRGTPITHLTSRDGRWAYTLYSGYELRRGRHARATGAAVHALDTLTGWSRAVDLRPFPRHQNPFLVAMALSDDGDEIEVLNRDPALEGARVLQSVETAALRPPREPGGVLAWEPFLGFAFDPPRRPGNLVLRVGTAGHSAQGRPIVLRQYGDPALEGEVLVFGCIHGDECAGSEIQPVSPEGRCPDVDSDIYFVPDLNPDGRELGTRLNGRGVDLNRNFPSSWRPIGTRGDPQHSGPRPLSEPETRLAARIVRRVRPEVTIWLHQHSGPRRLVRAWGGSVSAARRFAELARIPFRRLPWPDGTAPNWQNHAFPGTASFVVELPPGQLPRGADFNLGGAIVRLAREVGKD